MRLAIDQQLIAARRHRAQILAAGGPPSIYRQQFADASAVLDQAELEQLTGGLGFLFVPPLLWLILAAVGTMASVFLIVQATGAAARIVDSGAAAVDQIVAQDLPQWMRTLGWLGVTAAAAMLAIAIAPRARARAA